MLLAKLTAVRALVARDGTDGQGLAEYALILALIAVVCIVAVTFMGTQVAGEMSVIGSTVESVR